MELKEGIAGNAFLCARNVEEGLSNDFEKYETVLKMESSSSFAV